MNFLNNLLVGARAGAGARFRAGTKVGPRVE